MIGAKPNPFYASFPNPLHGCSNGRCNRNSKLKCQNTIVVVTFEESVQNLKRLHTLAPRLFLCQYSIAQASVARAMENLKKVPVSPFRLSSLLRLEKDPKLAFQLFQNPNPNSPPSPKPFRYSLLSYDLIITKLGRAKMFHEMEQILNQMKQETRFLPKEIIFCNVITFYGRSRLPNKALQMFNQIPSFRCQRTVKSFNTLLNAFWSCREFGRMKEFWVDIDQYASPDVCSYNILIKACCSNVVDGSVDDAWKLFDEMQSKGIRPNAVTFASLVSLYCANGRLDDALKLKEDMVKVYGLKPNVFLYTSLMKGYCKVNDIGSAFKMKEELFLDKELGLDSAVYTTLISGLFKAGRKGEVLGILDEMKANTIEPDIVTYNAMISGFCNDKDFDSALGVLNGMKDKKCEPDVISYNVIIAGFCKEGKLRDAIDLFEDMPRRDCSPDIVTYRTLFDGLCDAMDFTEAGLVLDEMVFKGYFPRVASLSKFVDGVCLDGKITLLESVITSLAKGKIGDFGICKTIITSVCSKDELLNSIELVDTLIIP